MPAQIEAFLPACDIAERHEIQVRAPATLVFRAAQEMDLESVPLVRAIFRMREWVLGSRPADPQRPRGLVAMTTSLGWQPLAEVPDRELVMGAVTQPWEADVVFRGLPPDEFRTFAAPGMVKIAWSLEAESLEPATTQFTTQTRVLATDAAARARFRRYWFLARFGIIAIRLLMLPALRREAETRYRRGAAGPEPGQGR